MWLIFMTVYVYILVENNAAGGSRLLFATGSYLRNKTIMRSKARLKKFQKYIAYTWKMVILSIYFSGLEGMAPLAPPIR